MSFAAINGVPVVSGTVSLPLVGAWVAEVRFDASEAVEGAATLRLGEALELRGTVVAGGVYAGAGYTRLVGGNGKLSVTLPSRYYQDVPARIPIGDALAEAGETLAPSSSGALLDAWLPLWTRSAAKASEVVGQLVEAVGANDGAWRVLPDGFVWVGQDAWDPAPRFEFVQIEEHPTERRIEIATEDPRLLPGVTFLDRRVSHVRHVLTPEALRTHVWFV